MQKTATAYLRVSTGDQQNSLEVQLAAISRLAMANGYHVEAIYTDVGISGSTAMESRPQGARALAAKTDALISWKLDRCFRNSRDALNMLHALHSRGIAFVSEDTHDTSTPVGKLIFTVLSGVAEMERDMIRGRILATAAKRKAAGELTGHVPFGQKLEAGKLVPDPGEQAVLAGIRKAIASGASRCSIAKDLTARKVPTKRGGQAWYASTVKSVLGL